MDHETLESHKRYTAALAKLALVTGSDGEVQSTFIGFDEYWAIRDYLNLHELMAVGILNNVFDDHVCQDFWAGEMRRGYQSAMPLIKNVQSIRGQEGTYREMIKVAKDWEEKRREGGANIKARVGGHVTTSYFNALNCVGRSRSSWQYCSRTGPPSRFGLSLVIGPIGHS
jgi:hypothetical protein